MCDVGVEADLTAGSVMPRQENKSSASHQGSERAELLAGEFEERK